MDNPDEPKESKNELGTTPSRLSKAASESVSDPSIGSLETRNSQNGDESVAGVVVRAIATDLPLTKNQSNQQATTFLFSLIEGRCKSQARSTINSGRRKEDQLSEDDPEVCALAESIFKETVVVMKRAGRFPEEVDIPGPSERRDYLKAFDTRLSDIATRQYPVSAVDRITYNRFEDSRPYSFSEDVSSLFDRSQLHSCSHSQNLVPQPFIRVPQMMASSPLDSLLYPSGIDAYQQESAYHRKFSQICLLGKGGFGQVFRARHKLDDQDYAIKQIRVSASQLRSIHDQVQLEHLLKELRALAKLQHRNVVRYYDSWCEYRAASWRNTRSGQHLLENGPSNLR
jgi:translation initiation factor 2-alpha kinase 3